MTASFVQPFGATTVSPDSAFDRMDHTGPSSAELPEDHLPLTHLQHAWNRLDLCEYAPMFRGNAKRKMYVQDMMAVRHGQSAYYSLGVVEQRQAFTGTFLSLRSRRLQELFLQCASTCLQENRFMMQADLVLIVQEGNGKRHQQEQVMDEEVVVMQRASKRQRTSCSFGGIQCFS
mmetsp:Transcript_3404/g.5610  ORF Transcript_3404/g.5610 Transcript_3404/m.5610 type:complete len:175 (-) Transcript_3404:156-680(-)|eukprot:CAMPEP_0119012700 /NCGR_PEP_ID=MMETSP1176-20130426/7297_1 /TAXON_ID=265551 /ORGANISM="Synedropsis recta cf, Strain CCMP1620" /LENGTH=174 /DNA_ID=CAMNT_0006965711 /DNA_START=99 /DNA_END=623 /DNA_ORIENTATION=+